MFATGETVGLGKWIIDDICLVILLSALLICPKEHLCSYKLNIDFLDIGRVCLLLIHSADPQSMAVVITVITMSFVRFTF